MQMLTTVAVACLSYIIYVINILIIDKIVPDVTEANLQLAVTGEIHDALVR